MSALGAVLVVAGAALAGRGRPLRGPQPAFVIAGPYRRMRNPLLAGVLLVTIGAAIASGAPALVVATVVLGFAAHVFVVRVEEPRLAARFGDAYRVYLRRVPRWVPRTTRGDDDQLEL